MPAVVTALQVHPRHVVHALAEGGHVAACVAHAGVRLLGAGQDEERALDLVRVRLRDVVVLGAVAVQVDVGGEVGAGVGEVHEHDLEAAPFGDQGLRVLVVPQVLLAHLAGRVVLVGEAQRCERYDGCDVRVLVLRLCEHNAYRAEAAAPDAHTLVSAIHHECDHRLQVQVGLGEQLVDVAGAHLSRSSAHDVVAARVEERGWDAHVAQFRGARVGGREVEVAGGAVHHHHCVHEQVRTGLLRLQHDAAQGNVVARLGVYQVNQHVRALRVSVVPVVYAHALPCGGISPRRAAPASIRTPDTPRSPAHRCPAPAARCCTTRARPALP